jgi:ABC-2 type transport system ATP-binding protein
LDLTAYNQTIINHSIQVNTSEAWKPFTAFPRREFPNRLPNPEEYFYFIGDLRGQNKADVDAFIG